MALRNPNIVGASRPLTTTHEPSSYTGEKERRQRPTMTQFVLNTRVLEQIINQLREKGVTIKLVMQVHGIIAIFMGFSTLILPHRYAVSSIGSAAKGSHANSRPRSSTFTHTQQTHTHTHTHGYSPGCT